MKSYLARPIEEVKVASYEERAEAFKNAEKLQSNLQTANPCFVKSMVRSHVYSCFWLVSQSVITFDMHITCMEMAYETMGAGASD